MPAGTLDVKVHGGAAMTDEPLAGVAIKLIAADAASADGRRGTDEPDRHGTAR